MRDALGALVLVGLLALATGSGADVLETRDGHTLNGAFRGATEEVLRFETADGDLHLIPLSKVASVRFGPAPAAAKPREAAPAPAAPTAAAPSKARSTRAPAPAAQTATPAAAATPAARPAVPAIRRVLVPAGTRLRVRITDSIDPRRSTEGDRFAALLESPITAGDLVVAPAQSKIYGVVTAASTTGPLVNRLQLELKELQIQGQRIAIVTGTQQPVAETATGGDAPADAAPSSAREARIASGTLLEFRLLQPLEMQVREVR